MTGNDATLCVYRAALRVLCNSFTDRDDIALGVNRSSFCVNADSFPDWDTITLGVNRSALGILAYSTRCSWDDVALRINWPSLRVNSNGSFTAIRVKTSLGINLRTDHTIFVVGITSGSTIHTVLDNCVHVSCCRVDTSVNRQQLF